MRSKIRVNRYLNSKKARRSLGKKAQQGPESQLNWIFILIVGAIIIAFFSVIVLKQKGASDIKVSGKLTKQLNTVFVGAKSSSGTLQEIATPNLQVRFACNDYYIGQVSQRLGNRVIFAPEYLSGNKVTTWTLDWTAPFKIASFLFVTTPKIRYVLVLVGSDDSLLKKINLSLPVKLNRNFNLITYSGDDYKNLKPLGEDSTRFIFFGGSASFKPKIPSAFVGKKAKASALQVFPSQNKLRFFQLNGNSFLDLTAKSAFGPSGPIPYLDEFFLLGAVFSDNPKTYSCLVDKAWKNWNIVTKVFNTKFNSISSLYKGTSCEGFYKNNLDLETLQKTTAKGFGKSAGLATDLSNLAAAITNLQRTNQRAQLSSCPLIY